MKIPHPSSVIFLVAAALTASPAAPGLNIGDLRDRIDQQIARLGSIVMHEEISRYARARGETRKVDEFGALVEMSASGDSLTSLRHNGRPCQEAQIRGAWSFGDFSALLRVSRDALDNAATTLTAGPQRETLIAAFHFPASSERWFISPGGRIYWLDFRGEIEASAATGDVQRIFWVANAPLSATGDILQVQRSVSFAPVDVSGETFILPQSAEYRVTHSGSRVEWNTAQFGQAARYGSLISLRFENH